MTEDEFMQALSSLIAKGLIEEVIMEDGQLGYQATEDGLMIAEYLTGQRSIH